MADGQDENHDHGSTSWSPGACETCWADAFTESKLHGGTQVEHYLRLLRERDGTPGHGEGGPGYGA